jgi:hypothetical protein
VDVGVSAADVEDACVGPAVVEGAAVDGGTLGGLAPGPVEALAAWAVDGEDAAVAADPCRRGSEGTA